MLRPVRATPCFFCYFAEHLNTIYVAELNRTASSFSCSHMNWTLVTFKDIFFLQFSVFCFFAIQVVKECPAYVS